MDWRRSRFTRHHNLLTSAAPITGPIVKQGGGRTAGKRLGRVVGGGAITSSYDNLGGTGDRRTLLNPTINGLTLAGATVTALYDGDTSNAGTSPYFTGGSNGGYFQIDCGAGKSAVIDGIRWRQSSSSATHGSWVLSGSDDNSVYTDFPETITLGGALVREYTFTNAVRYRYYRLRKTAGSVSTSPRIFEIEFRIGGLE